MLVKIKDGSAMRMAHEGKWYNFNKGEVKECPESIIPAFRGFVIPAQPKAVATQVVIKVPSTMPIINAEQPKIKIPVKIKTTKRKLSKRRIS